MADPLHGGEGRVDPTVGARPEAPETLIVKVCIRRQAVVGEELGHAVTALRFMGFHLHPLEEPWELWGRCHRLGSDVKRALLQSCQLAQAIWDLLLQEFQQPPSQLGRIPLPGLCPTAAPQVLIQEVLPGGAEPQRGPQEPQC